MSEAALKLVGGDSSPLGFRGFRGRGGWGAWLAAVRAGEVFAGLTLGQAKVLAAVQAFADERGRCWAGTKALAVASGLKHERTVKKCRRELIEIGLLAEALEQDKKALVVELMPPPTPGSEQTGSAGRGVEISGSDSGGGGVTGESPGGDWGVTGGVTGESPKGLNESEVNAAAGGGGGLPLFDPAVYDGEAVKVLVAGGLVQARAHGLCCEYRATAAQCQALVEVMDWLDGEAAAGREQAVRDRGAWVRAAMKAGNYGYPRRMWGERQKAALAAKRAAAVEAEAEARRARRAAESEAVMTPAERREAVAAGQRLIRQARAKKRLGRD